VPSVQFWELEGFPTEDFSGNRFTAQRRLLCYWADRYLLRYLLVAWPGAQYPYISDFPVRCTGVGIEPFAAMKTVAGMAADMASYEYAILNVRYESPQYGDAQPYPSALNMAKHLDPSKAISESFEPSLEALRLDYSLFKWGDGAALKPDEAPVRSVYRMAYSLTRHNQTSIPGESLSYVGKINDDTVTPILLPGLSFAAHTLMYIPPSIDVATDESGTGLIDVTHRFAFKEEGWRKFWRGDTKQYEEIKVKSSGANYDQPEAVDFGVFFP
jgi:hypothetical protein